jgi:hypothetical protein
MLCMCCPMLKRRGSGERSSSLCSIPTTNGMGKHKKPSAKPKHTRHSILYNTIYHPNGDGDVCTKDSTCSAGAQARKEGRTEGCTVLAYPTTTGMGMRVGTEAYA